MRSTRLSGWPDNAQDLERIQDYLAAANAYESDGQPELTSIGACFVCFLRERAWVGAALKMRNQRAQTVVLEGSTAAPYIPGLLAMREGPLLEAAVQRLPERPDVLMVNATGQDHPRRAGLAVHLGAILEVPTVGVTERSLVAKGDLPSDERGATAPVFIEDEIVGYWVRTRTGVRPLIAHAGWGIDPETAAAILIKTAGKFRTPQPIREARRAARAARGSANKASLL